MKSTQIAEKIVDKFANYELLDVEEYKDGDGNVVVKKHQLHKLTVVDVAGYVRTATNTDKKTARQELVDFFKNELDGGNLVLSDTWAEDNL